jgi:MoaA/NifB/PqqE/SkfB family radical SAM enzyme
MLDYLAGRGIVTSITSNGLSTEVLTDAELARFRSVEFSLDFPSEQEHDAFRGEGNWRTVMRGLERGAHLGLPVTVTAVMMRLNYDKLPALARVAATFQANLRVNVYQPSKSDHFSVSYEQFWQGFTQLLESTRLVATTEPVLAAVLGLESFAGPG